MRVYTEFAIKMPRWKQRVVGLASYRVSDHNKVDIMAAGKDGERYYPDTYYISGADVRKCEKQMLPQGLELYLVPINSLEVLVSRPKKVKPKPIEEPIVKPKEESKQVQMDIKEEYNKDKFWR